MCSIWVKYNLSCILCASRAETGARSTNFFDGKMVIQDYG